MTNKPLKLFRADKTTKSNDDFKVLIVGLFIGISLMFGSLLYGRFPEYRWYRNLTNLTPFSKIVLESSALSEDGLSIQVTGTMKKDRCDFDFSVENNPIGYVTDQYGVRNRVAVSTKIEDAFTGIYQQSRPPGSNIENWGPWEIDVTGATAHGEQIMPSKFEIIVFHRNCPTTPIKQVNEFVKGDWVNFKNQIAIIGGNP